MNDYINYAIEAIKNPKSIIDVAIILHLFLFLLFIYFLIRAVFSIKKN